MPPDLDSLSNDELMQLAGIGNSPSASAPSAGVNLDSLSNEELMKIAGINQPSTFSQGVKHFLSGGAEGVMGLASLAQDYLSPSGFMDRLGNKVINAATGQNEPTAGQRTAQELESILPAHDPRYRYERTIGQFVGPTLLTGGAGALAEGGNVLAGATALRPLAGALTGAVSSQGAQDIVPNGPNIPFTDVPAIPTLAGLIGGAVPSVLSELGSGAVALFRGATPAELKGSAALAQRELTGLTPDEISQAMQNAPADRLSRLMTTAELTDNPAMAQIEKTLGGRAGPNSNQYKQLDTRRAAARNDVLDEMSAVKGVNNVGLDKALIEKALAEEAAKRADNEARWNLLPRRELIDITPEQAKLSSIIDNRQGGLPLTAKVKELAGQVLDEENRGYQTSGALQNIRSDALGLLRDEKITMPFDVQVANELHQSAQNALAEGLTGQDYRNLLKAQAGTREYFETFGRDKVGGTLTNKQLTPEDVVSKVLRGDAQSVDELNAAIGYSPDLIEGVKRSVVNSIPRADNGQITPHKMIGFLDANEGQLKQLFGEQHYAAMQRIADDLRSQAKVSEIANFASKGGSVTSQKGTVASVINDLLSESVLPGSGPLGKIAEGVKQSRGIRNAQSVEDMLFRASLDPNFALELAQTPSTTRVFNALERFLRLTSNVRDQSARNAGIVAGQQYSNEAPATDRQDTRSGLNSLSALPTAPTGIAGLPNGQSSARQALAGASSPQAPTAPQLAPGDLQLNKSLFNPISLLDSAFGPSVAHAEMVDEPNANSNSIFSASPERSIFSVPARMLKAVEHVESGGKADAVSNKGAVGVMQLEPIAVRDVLRARNIDDSALTDAQIRAQVRDPDTNRAIGAAYLQMLLERFDGDPELALAAYNAGPSRVSKLLKTTGGDSYSDIESRLPLETRKYVPKVKSIFEKA